MDVFMGLIQPFGFNFAPQNWATCDGQILQVAQNSALYSLLNTYYGGNGSQTFGLPDLRGRTLIHQGTRSGGGPSYVMGQNGGTENATLMTNNLPSHSHSLMALNGVGTVSTASSNVLATGNYTDSDGNSVPVQVYAPAGSGMVPMAPQAIGPIGSSTPFSILQPYLTVSLCIALQGYYPTRS